MAYIYLEELKECLPIILSDWIEPGDESWEWIFQEIEQTCHVGKRLKGKKWRKKLDSMVETHSTVLSAHRNDINELTKKVDELKRYVIDNLSPRINSLSNDVEAAKSMAQTAKQRTEVDYSKYSGKSDGEISYGNKCASCKHVLAQPLDQPCVGCCYNGINISGMDKWEAKENE